SGYTASHQFQAGTSTLYWVSGNPGLHPKKSIPLLIFFVFLLAEVQRKIFFKNFSFGGKEGL
ncbi:unnamed protein product, partial [Tenebrio molitor]